ncbi:hypothetical protein ACQCSX_03860 [Pseudarthrobacter sp. P1]|uniref:hypothetical protein n=1 Tax=Pseudarthrobacter sp. P1 TaxID=3418418 RepID=UPI003CF13FBA
MLTRTAWTRPAQRAAAGARAMVDLASMDFLTVDDGGFFGYAPSARAVEADNEYPAEVECVIDRAGHNYRLVRSGSGQLVLGPAPGTVDMGWLRASWAQLQAQHPARYPLHRIVDEASDVQFLAMLFDVLQLAGDHPVPGGLWHVLLAGDDLRVESLRDASTLLFQQARPQDAVVRDPLGHDYRPEPKGHRILGFTTGRYILYTEQRRGRPADHATKRRGDGG